MRGLAGVEVQRGGRSAAEQEMLRGGASGRRFRVWGGGYMVGDKGGEDAGWFKEGSQGSRGGRARGKAGEDHGRRCAAGGGRRKKGPIGGAGLPERGGCGKD
jgi:hypothetical protein